MRQLKSIFAFVVALALLMIAGPAWAGAPTQFIKKQTDRVSEALAIEDSNERSEQFADIANQVIDFRTLASRSLGKHWDKREEAEREEFLGLLRKLLRANYEKKLAGKTAGDDYTINYDNERARGDRAIVETTVVWGEGEEKRKPVDYKLMNKTEGWVVYDVVIDDISLEETYRESYTKVIEEEGWDALLEKMRKKIDSLQSE